MQTSVTSRIGRRQGWLCLLLVGLVWPVKAQSIPADSAISFKPSTLVKWRPLRLVFNSINLAVEQTVSPRGSVGLEAYRSVGSNPAFRVLGTMYGGGLTYRYYPLRLAPKGLYIGSRLSYDQLHRNFILQLLTAGNNKGNLSLWTFGPMVGYQRCSRSGFILDLQGSVGLISHLRYERSEQYGQVGIVNDTRFALILPRLYIGVGYRFPNARHRAGGPVVKETT